MSLRPTIGMAARSQADYEADRRKKTSWTQKAPGPVPLHHPVVVDATPNPRCAAGTCDHDTFAECDAAVDKVEVCAECLRVARAVCPTAEVVVHTPILWPCPTARDEATRRRPQSSNLV